ncbi:MAG: kinase, partial [Lactobacillaceae bacterium]|nr:kinase [Lactobacillaceae bacterium]
MFKVPGKLMLAGEYAVTKAGHKAVVMAINRFADQDSTQFIDQATGNKYGFGSSAAYLVRQIRNENPTLSNEQVFVDALNQTRQSQPLNSGADVAASTYGGVVVYQRDQVLEQLTIPKDWHLLVGWTKTPATTSELVKKARLSDNFLNRSDVVVDQIIEAVKSEDFEKFQKNLFLAQENLSTIKSVMTDDLSTA